MHPKRDHLPLSRNDDGQMPGAIAGIHMKIQTVTVSDYCPLDSNVYTGGGTDVTCAIQKILDRAKDEGGIKLVMDGAALVSHLRLYSNTTIECLNKDCGFYQKDGSNNSIVINAEGSKKEITARNITLRGGTYNQNCAHQLHHREMMPDEPAYEGFLGVKYVFAIEFYGVENLVLEDLTIRDFRTYAFALGCFKNCRIENVWLDLPGRMQANNQDGFHFWGPGQFLTIRNVGGRVGDDFMNIGPDEEDEVSSISDVIVDGVILDDADQAIRVLSRGTGRVDRLTVRNVTGTYRSFGFYINSWFPGKTCGQFGDMFFENIDLKHTAPNYDYRKPMLFSVGGEIRSLICKNIRHVDPIDGRALFELGLPFHSTIPETINDFTFEGCYPHIDYFEIDGMTILENNHDADDANYIRVFGRIGTMVVRNVNVVRPSSGNSTLIEFSDRAEVDTAVLNSVYTKGMNLPVKHPEKVRNLFSENVIFAKGGDPACR